MINLPTVQTFKYLGPTIDRGAIQVLRNSEGGGGSIFFLEKALRRCKVQRYLALRGGGWGSNLQEKSVT